MRKEKTTGRPKRDAAAAGAKQSADAGPVKVFVSLYNSAAPASKQSHESKVLCRLN